MWTIKDSQMKNLNSAVKVCNTFPQYVVQSPFAAIIPVNCLKYVPTNFVQICLVVVFNIAHSQTDWIYLICEYRHSSLAMDSQLEITYDFRLNKFNVNILKD